MSLFPCLKVKNEKWNLFSWVVVIGLYAFPTLFYAMRIFEVWRTNAALSTHERHFWDTHEFIGCSNLFFFMARKSPVTVLFNRGPERCFFDRVSVVV